MNPAIFTVLKWEKELELQRQGHYRRQRVVPQQGLNEPSGEVQTRSLFARLLSFRSQPQCSGPTCERPQTACR